MRQWTKFVASSLVGLTANVGSYAVLTSLVGFFDRYRLLALVTGVGLGGSSTSCSRPCSSIAGIGLPGPARRRRPVDEREPGWRSRPTPPLDPGHEPGSRGRAGRRPPNRPEVLTAGGTQGEATAAPQPGGLARPDRDRTGDGSPRARSSRARSSRARSSRARSSRARPSRARPSSRVLRCVLAAGRTRSRGPGAADRGELLPRDPARLRLGRRHSHDAGRDPGVGRARGPVVRARKRLPAGPDRRRPLLAAPLHDLLAGAQAVGLRSGRLPHRQPADSFRQYRARGAPAGAAGGARRVVRGRVVRGASPARGIRGLGNRPQGSARDPVLPGRVSRLAALHRGAAGGTLRRGARPVRGRNALQVDRGHPARGAAHLALVEARSSDRGRAAPATAVLRGGAGDRRPRPVDLREGESLLRPFAGRAIADRGALARVLCREAAVAGRPRPAVPALGDWRRESVRLGLRHRRRRRARAPVVAAPPHGPGASRLRAVLRGRAFSRARLHGLRLHEHFVRGRPLPVPRRGRDRGAGCGRRGNRRRAAAGRGPQGRVGHRRGGAARAGGGDLESDARLRGRRDPVRPQRFGESGVLGRQLLRRNGVHQTAPLRRGGRAPSPRTCPQAAQFGDSGAVGGGAAKTRALPRVGRDVPRPHRDRARQGVGPRGPWRCAVPAGAPCRGRRGAGTGPLPAAAPADGRPGPPPARPCPGGPGADRRGGAALRGCST